MFLLYTKRRGQHQLQSIPYLTMLDNSNIGIKIATTMKPTEKPRISTIAGSIKVAMRSIWLWAISQLFRPTLPRASASSPPISPTAEIIDRIEPVYNFKAAE